MWDKPRELTGYTSNGYEISYYTSGKLDIHNVLEAFKNSPGHNALLVNSGDWENSEWTALGIGINGSYANVWFGNVSDPAGQPGDCMAKK